MYNENIVKVKKLHEKATLPVKATNNSVGYDITSVGYEKTGNNIYMLKTGIALCPMHEDLFCYIYARSSLHRYGVMPVNGVGVIDNDYRGEIMFPLFRYNADIPLPDFNNNFRFGQLVFHFSVKKLQVELTDDDFPATERGDGGFGSTG
jgi:dUTP pyrophosphatase